MVRTKHLFFGIVFINVLLFSIVANCQITATLKTVSEEHMIRQQLRILTDTNMHGRGYVQNGLQNASQFIQKKFKEFKLKGIKNGSYVQQYSFPVNTFPGEMKLIINKQELIPGVDFIIEPSSLSFFGDKMKMKVIDLKQVVDTSDWINLISTFRTDTVYCLEEVESLCKALDIKKETFPYILPKGCYIIKRKDKLNWGVKLDTCHATVFYVKESSLPKKIKSIDVAVRNAYNTKSVNDNIIGYVTGKIKDTFIAFTAHYDHLGMMGNNTTFPGASDNASGTALLIYLASYFATHPQKYSIMFIAFSGEEAELIGSKYYTKHPAIPLKSMKFLFNLDIVGDATDGITVVNGTEYYLEYDLLQTLNTNNKYLPSLRQRGPAPISDHHYFTEAGVPAFYIYSNGGKGFYHDIYDVHGNVSLFHIDDIAHLLIDFTRAYN